MTLFHDKLLRSFDFFLFTIDDLPVAVSIVLDTGATHTLVRFMTGSRSRAEPVRHTIITKGTLPSSLTQAGVGFLTISILRVTTLTMSY